MPFLAVKIDASAPFSINAIRSRWRVIRNTYTIPKIPRNAADDLEETYACEHTPAPLEAMQAREREQFVKAAINRLPKMEALIITLFYLNESPIEEIEQITGLSNSNVKVKLFRARKALEKELQFLL
ncbi:hypothetical protein GCM10010967_08810 [Dyadobacter beijingensis]|uniref:RNA polymerase sigma factor 70 region 4 type 2 domain-containing protein n=1 Tax=Dyadobacter beijingensis TaxID=365489 RepID=A0ABQ2HEU7_9BACT|nr:sigma-70 family RNA polymerase sigma factor [Dyadobacter beijingensis]GGM79324.1 hypothetical protein GCM10010967_08810 [Dyadobacter beijingensis]